MLQSVTTTKTPRRIPSLCSTTGVCWRESICVAGAGAAIRRLLPTSVELCRPPAKVPYSAEIGRLLPTFAGLKLFCPKFPPSFPLKGEALNDRRLHGCAATVMPFLSALSGERGRSPRR